jgi:hypothetical protein
MIQAPGDRLLKSHKGRDRVNNAPMPRVSAPSRPSALARLTKKTAAKQIVGGFWSEVLCHAERL